MATHNRGVTQGDKERVQKEFGGRLAEIRSGKKITQENFAFDVGVDRTYISYLERGKRNPSLYMLWRLAKSLNISLRDLIN